jgi:hypothetical protein
MKLASFRWMMTKKEHRWRVDGGGEAALEGAIAS